MSTVAVHDNGTAKLHYPSIPGGNVLGHRTLVEGRDGLPRQHHAFNTADLNQSPGLCKLRAIARPTARPGVR